MFVLRWFFKRFLLSLWLIKSCHSLSESALWGIRTLSAGSTLLGLVVYSDRPQGSVEADVLVKPSQVPGAGLGLFAARKLEKGTILGQYPGTCLPLESNLVKVEKHPQCAAYVWRFSDSKFIIDPTNAVGELEDECRGGSPVSSWIFDSFLPFWAVPTDLCRINEPPIGFDRNVLTDENLNKRIVTFSVERDVMAGEELFVDYGTTYDRSGYGRT